jgi:ubiquinol-cytochrome c reductase iron-sulfur subunit
VRPQRRNWLVAGLLLLVGRRSPTPRPERVLPKGPPSPFAETAVLLLLGLSSACAIGFVLVYALDPPAQTQLLGLAIGLSLLLLAAALVVVGRSLVVTEELAEEYPPADHPEDEAVVAELIEQAGDRFTRRGLFKLGLLGAGGALTLAALTPVVSLGPIFRVGDFLRTPWRRGRRLVDEHGRPLRAAQIALDSFYTAFPEGLADSEDAAAPVIVVRLSRSSLRLPPALAGYEANGIVAYSKICTHAGCAIAMYRAPLYQPDEPAPALVCPCHYSTFDPADGGTVLFGPAGRKLPMLPIAIDRRGYLRAKGTFDGPVGPSWWGVRIWKART